MYLIGALFGGLIGYLIGKNVKLVEAGLLY